MINRTYYLITTKLEGKTKTLDYENQGSYLIELINI
jgi:hypothetical protein